MKHFFFFSVLSLLLFSSNLFAQSKNIFYQGIAINGQGSVLASQSITVRLSVLDDINSGTASYVETQTATTSATGAFSLMVGTGTAVTGTYSSINLMSSVNYLKVEIKPSGGSYTTISNGPVAQSVIAGWQCGNPLNVNHVKGTVAPVNKSVTYGTVTNVPGATTKCWITSNLGADHQATAVSDATEASAGWYWQFNRKQGYKHDGTTLTPAWTITSIDETSDWLTANDPCTSELGSGWRLPTSTEWTNVDASGNWTTWTGPWASGLKLHAAGCLYYTVGSLSLCGSYGFYWSSSQRISNYAWILSFDSGNSYMYYEYKAEGFSVRCLRD